MTDTTIQTIKCTTDVEVLRKDYTWYIKNFSFITNQNEKKIKSSIFTVGNNREYKWRLRLYPNGNGVKGSRNYVALYLQLITPSNKVVVAKFNFFIIMADDTKHKMSSHDLHYFTQYKSLGDHEFIKRNRLLDERNGFIVNDNLTIVCELSVGTDKRYEVTEELYSSVMTSDDPENLAKHLEILLESKSLVDVELIAKDGSEPLLAHKPILAARSPVFAAIFQHNMRENKCNKVEITDVTASVLKQLVRFIYTGKTENLDNMANARDLLIVADKYALDDLKYLCEQTMTKNITVENVIATLEVAEKHNATKLKEYSTNFMLTHARPLIRHFINHVDDHNANPTRIWYDFSFFDV